MALLFHFWNNPRDFQQRTINIANRKSTTKSGCTPRCWSSVSHIVTLLLDQTAVALQIARRDETRIRRQSSALNWTQDPSSAFLGSHTAYPRHCLVEHRAVTWHEQSMYVLSRTVGAVTTTTTTPLRSTTNGRAKTKDKDKDKDAARCRTTHTAQSRAEQSRAEQSRAWCQHNTHHQLAVRHRQSPQYIFPRSKQLPSSCVNVNRLSTCQRVDDVVSH